jgi:predicted amidohydrolase
MDKETLNLLRAKISCIRALSAILEFRQIEPVVFDEARKIFREYGLTESVKAVNQLENFAMDLQQYRNLEEIPDDEKARLMLTLQPMKALNGYTSQGIANSVPKETFVTTKPDTEVVELKSVPIEKTVNSWVRVCLVQLDFSLEILAPPREFGYVLCKDDKELIKKKVFSALSIAQSEKANIVCFPELSFAPEWAEQVKREFKDMVVIGGSYYKDKFNTCPVIILGTEYHIRKINPSPDIEEEVGPGRGMNRGKEVLVFQTRFGKFATLICLDYIKAVHHILYSQDEEKKNVDFIINPSCNRDVVNYQERANQDCQAGNFPYILQVNVLTIGGKKCGGTCIIGTEHDSALSRYEGEGYRPIGDTIRYKLLQAEGEMMAIADLDIARKAVPVPPTGLKMRSVSRYKFQNGQWQKYTV